MVKFSSLYILHIMFSTNETSGWDLNWLGNSAEPKLQFGSDNSSSRLFHAWTVLTEVIEKRETYVIFYIIYSFKLVVAF